MPKNKDINSVLIIGAGPIVIGQACEFDYSGTQACRALKEEGIRVVLQNSNPATIMTDPQIADATYIEPITVEYAEEIIANEKVDAILPTMGGQTALNCAMQLHEKGILKKYKTKLIGADFNAIRVAENRDEFRKLMKKINLETAKGNYATTLEAAIKVAKKIDTYPLIIRPSFTLGGTGGGIAYNYEEFLDICARGLSLSPDNSLLIEESLIGWKEYELEVVRDKNDNCIIVCGIENIDPLGVHTGDSITVAPILTLTDKEYQKMRSAAFKILRAIGVDTGGANVQFAVDPKTGRQIVIEMNPRVSRSSALASKATGFPIAKVAAKLAIGYSLDELSNEITGKKTPASFEPTLDYIVTKIPRFNFDKFPGIKQELNTQMKAVGEVMAIGRTFVESIQKAWCSLETGLTGFDPTDFSLEEIKTKLRTSTPDQLLLIADAIRQDLTIEEIYDITGVDRWFLHEIKYIVEQEEKIKSLSLGKLGKTELLEFKRDGFSDKRIAKLLKTSEIKIRNKRNKLKVNAAYHRVDSCAAEFPVSTAYQYSTYGEKCESNPNKNKRYVILGSGPNRIGQGIEFDYCCIHAVLALREEGYETIMVNCNPETVSTDYDISDRLYFEPLTVEHVLEILRIEKPNGVIVHTGGQTPLSIAKELEQAGIPIIGTSVKAIDRAEDRDEFRKLLKKCGLKQPENAVVTSISSGIKMGKALGYPLVVRPSYVLGGQAMKIIYSRAELERYLKALNKNLIKRGILLDSFLDHAIELDVDAICDGKNVIIAGILEHIEKAGVHSGDSSSVFPPHSISSEVLKEIEKQTITMAKELNVIGFMNVQFAVQGDSIHVLEINPRASRTIPFLAKATGWPIAKVATLAMAGQSFSKQKINSTPKPHGYFVKEVVFPFNRMPGVDTLLGPEMRSTGEVMGISNTATGAFFRGTEAISAIPLSGSVLLSVRDSDKPATLNIARKLHECGFKLVATKGTAKFITENTSDIPVEIVRKVIERKPTVVDVIKSGKIKIVINTVTAIGNAIEDSVDIRRTALAEQVLYFTTIEAAQVITAGISEKLAGHSSRSIPIQKRYALS